MEVKSEGSGRRRFLKSAFWGTLAAVGLTQAPKVMRIAEEYRWNPLRPENLKALFGTENPLSLNYQGQIKLGEGTSLYKEPRVEKPQEEGLVTVPTTGSTLLGTLVRGEEIVVENPFLFLKEAESFTPEERIISLNYQGKEKRMDSLGWMVFDIKGVSLPESVRGDSPYFLACSQIRVSTEKVTVSPEIDFGRVIS